MPKSVSAICLAAMRIKLGDQYLLTANPTAYGRSRGKTRIWEPPHGALTASPSGLFAIRKLGGALTNPESYILSLTAPPDRIPGLQEWLLDGQGRETDPFRVVLSHLLRDWSGDGMRLFEPADFEGVRSHFHGRSALLMGGADNKLYVMDVHSMVRLSEQTTAKIAKLVQQPRSPLYLASMEELTSGRNSLGEKITAPARSLPGVMHPAKELAKRK